jgi:hypothetical protein
MYKWHHKLTPTNVAGVPVAHDMAKGIQNGCQSDVSKYDPLNQDLGGQSDGINPHCHMMLSTRRKEKHPSGSNDDIDLSLDSYNSYQP